MATSEAEIWKIYTFRGYQVMVTQQWRDPFGRKMVHIEVTTPGEDRSEGLPEEVFLQSAVILPPALQGGAR